MLFRENLFLSFFFFSSTSLLFFSFFFFFFWLFSYYFYVSFEFCVCVSFYYFSVKFMTRFPQSSVTMPCVLHAFLSQIPLVVALSLSLSFSPLLIVCLCVLQLIASFYLRAFGKLKRPRKTKPKRNEYFYSIWRHKLPLTLSLGCRRPF